MALNTTQRKTLKDILRNYIDYLLEKKLIDWLPKLIVPVTLSSAEVFEYLRKNPESIKALNESFNLPFEIRDPWRLFVEYVINPEYMLPQEALNQLEAYPNYNPNKLVDMQLFESSLAEVEEESKKALIALRELYLEMTPLVGDSYGQNYRTFFFRVGRTPFNLDSFGPTPQAGEIQSEVEDYIQERYELALESQKELEALAQRLKVSKDHVAAQEALQINKQPIASASSSASTPSATEGKVLEEDLDLIEAYFALGEKHYTNKEYAEAMKWYLKAPEYAQAQFKIGLLFCSGKGVNQDYKEAVRWFEKAAEQGLNLAQDALGAYYGVGRGVAQDDLEAIKWLQKAAMQGYAEAQWHLGLYLKQGITQDYKEAVKWFQKAAEQGLDEAQYFLGACYDRGEGVSQNDLEAVKWYQKAALKGYAKAQYELGRRHYSGQSLNKDYKEAVKWYQRAAAQGHAKAQCHLGFCFGRGQGVKQDYKEAVKWYQRAAAQGEDCAQNNLGGYFERGNGVKQDYIEAVKWYQKAAEKGNARAQYHLGLCYANGRGIAKNYLEAVKWYQKAAEKGDKDAEAALKSMESCPSNGQCRIM